MGIYIYIYDLISNTLFIGPAQQKFERKIAIIFSSISLNIYFGCSKELSQ